MLDLAWLIFVLLGLAWLGSAWLVQLADWRLVVLTYIYSYAVKLQHCNHISCISHNTINGCVGHTYTHTSMYALLYLSPPVRHTNTVCNIRVCMYVYVACATTYLNMPLSNCASTTYQLVNMSASLSVSKLVSCALVKCVICTMITVMVVFLSVVCLHLLIFYMLCIYVRMYVSI